MQKILLTAENCELLETVMEKLEGIVCADLCAQNQIESFHKIMLMLQKCLAYAKDRVYLENIENFHNTYNSSQKKNFHNTYNSHQKFMNFSNQFKKFNNTHNLNQKSNNSKWYKFFKSI